MVFNEKGEAFISEKRTVKGTFMENLELNDFPFDVQVLQLFHKFHFLNSFVIVLCVFIVSGTIAQ